MHDLLPETCAMREGGRCCTYLGWLKFGTSNLKWVTWITCNTWVYKAFPGRYAELCGGVGLTRGVLKDFTR